MARTPRDIDQADADTKEWLRLFYGATPEAQKLAMKILREAVAKHEASEPKAA